jgi:DNA-binding HxlR family transcriptional regulator
MARPLNVSWLKNSPRPFLKAPIEGAIPVPVEYSLTDYGRSVSPLVESVRLWGKVHMERLTSEADDGD